MWPSIIDGIDAGELRLWCLRGLAQNPHLIHGVDGTLFISHGVAYPIFTAMRKIAARGEWPSPSAIYAECDRDHLVGLGLVEVFALVAIDARMTGTYLRKLAERFERETEYAAA